MVSRTAVEYVAGAYLAVWLAVIVYMGLIGQKVGRLEAELDRLEGELDAHMTPAGAGAKEPVA